MKLMHRRLNRVDAKKFGSYIKLITCGACKSATHTHILSDVGPVKSLDTESKNKQHTNQLVTLTKTNIANKTENMVRVRVG